MAHVPIRDLVKEARGIAKHCMEEAQLARASDAGGGRLLENAAGRLANLADHIESLLNDYDEPDQGQLR